MTGFLFHQSSATWPGSGFDYWTCHKCGFSVPNGCTHHCPSTSATPWQIRLQGATSRTCPLCDGKGVNPVLPNLVCPKCNGEKKV